MSNPLVHLLSAAAPAAAPRLLDAVLVRGTPEGVVAMRLSEVEAYGGPADSDLPDPGAHTYRGPTARNAAMFGPPAHLYVYFSYGLHHAVNFVCRPEGTAGGVLIRAGEIVAGQHLALARRSARRASAPGHAVLARGPGNVAQALGLDRADDAAALRYLGTAPDPVLAAREFAVGSEVREPWAGLVLAEHPAADFVVTPRTGVSGAGGTDEFPWRFALAGDPTVSPYRKAVPKRRRRPARAAGQGGAGTGPASMGR